MSRRLCTCGFGLAGFETSIVPNILKEDNAFWWELGLVGDRATITGYNLQEVQQAWSGCFCEGLIRAYTESLLVQIDWCTPPNFLLRNDCSSSACGGLHFPSISAMSEEDKPPPAESDAAGEAKALLSVETV